jgi:hypothetical protein
MTRLGAAASVLLLFWTLPVSAQGFKWRGVLEGFYGQPWTWQQRQAMVDWMSLHGDNLFVIAPKDDALLRKDWRRPLPEDYLDDLSLLQRRAKARGVALAWTLSPLGVKLRDPAELASALAKYRQVLSLGVRKLVIAFDDTEPRPRQIDFANGVLRALAPQFPDLEMTFIPAVYWSTADQAPYFALIASELDSRFLVGWTGPGIISETITAQEGRRFREYVRHKLVLGDNYPVQDRLLDSGPLYLGPLLGRDAGLTDSQEAFVSNATPLMDASKVPLQTAADFARDPAHYDPEISWKRALKDNHVPEVLARECVTSWISDPAPEWIRKDSIGNAVEAYESGAHNDELKRRLSLLRLASSAATKDLMPWTTKLASEADSVLRGFESANDPAGQSPNPAVVGDFALERFLLHSEAARAGQPPPDTVSVGDRLRAYAGDPAHAQPAQAALRSLANCDSILLAAAPNGWARQLAPWFEVLAQSSRRALASVDDSVVGHIASLPDSVWRWRTRVRFIPLLTSRALLENHFARTESAWSDAPAEVKPAGRWLGIWLWLDSFARPSAFPVVLSHQLRTYAQSGDGAELEGTFRFLENFPDLIRKQAGWRMVPEMGPWLDQVGLYGKLGRLSLSYAQRLQTGDTLTTQEKAQWEHLRRRLASSNGLELCGRLNFMLDDFVRWRRLPAQTRPARFKVEWPADPAQLL